MKKEAFWAEQYRRHIGKMVGACYRYVADWDLAEDLAQDAFLAAMEKASTFRAFGSFEGWLKKIAVNQALMHVRDCPEMVEWDENLHSQEVEEIADDPELSRTDFTQEELLEVVGKLPVKQRTVFNLYAVEHYSHSKIAETLGISVANSKVLLSRARAELQQRLKAVARKR
ncbi:MAG: sigma-70 family RNA polymerase sigma factor [Bacteroidales bacterium]|nr:sigma-70 family RNA polymerase sigma factor [Bacteroidales bacterium]